MRQNRTRPDNRTTYFATLLAVLVSAAGAVVAGPIGAAPASQTLAGIVTHIADGDTLDVRVGQQVVKIRLEGIDAPEGGQAFGARARSYLRVLAFSQRAVVRVKNTDRYGRLVARVVVGGRDLSEEMVRAGLAWHYLEYSSDPRLAALEREARGKHVGLWADKSQVPPWVARRAGSTRSAPALRTPPTSRTANDARQGTTARGGNNATTAQGPFHGNVRSRVYHAPGCPDYDCPNCRAAFATRPQAEAAGYRPHRDCVGG